MNKQAKSYWNEFWNSAKQPSLVATEQFGFAPDELAQLIIQGKKTATCSGYDFYEWNKEPLPIVDLYTIVLNSQDEPVAIIKTIDVQVVPMNEVSVEFAVAEGEGDLSYEYWWNAHKEFFTKELAEYGKEFSEDMLLVCERFELIDVKK